MLDGDLDQFITASAEAGHLMPQLKALLFDLDGTLIDSMPHHHEAWVEWHRRRALTIDPAHFFVTTAGRSNAEIFADMLPGETPETLAG